MPLEQRLAIYNALIVTVGATLAAIAWVPDFESKQQQLSAFALLKDNPTGVLMVKDLGPASGGMRRYDVSYSILLKNTSNGSFGIVWSLDQLFLGTPDMKSGATPLPVNDPPDIWDPAPPGLIAWKEARYDLATDDDLYDPSVTSFFKERHKQVTAPGGGLTGPYEPGHVSGDEARYIIVANPNDFVSITVTYGMNKPVSWWQRIRGKVPSSLYEGANLVGETVRLADVIQPDCPQGIVVQNGQVISACKFNPL